MMQRLVSASALSAVSLAIAAFMPVAANAATGSWVGTHTMSAAVGSATAGAELQAGTSIHIAVSLNLRNKAELDAITADIMSGKSSKILSAEETQARFAPTAAQAEAVASYLRSQGFTNVTTNGNRTLVMADGTAATVKSAFNTELRAYNIEGRAAFANVKPAQVPASLQGIVSGVHGLDTVNRVHLAHKVASNVTQASSGVVGHLPTDFATIYDAASLPPASNTTVAIITAGDISQTITDLTAYTKKVGFAMPSIKQVPAGPQGTGTSGVIEWDLDSQTSLSTAGGQVKQMIFYIGHDAQTLTSVVEAFAQAASDDSAQVINASLGLCETGEAANGDETAIDASLELGVSQGQTWTISSGDSGAYECSRTKTGTSYPAVSPYATAVGGTTLSTTGTTTYASETVWSCSSYLLCQQLLGGGAGGGTSTTEAQPSWQAQYIGSATGREIPDIAFSADPNSGAILTINGGAGTEQVGGTSLSAPMFMGFWARIQTAHGNKLTSPNATLYQYASNAKYAPKFTHDVTSGSQGFSAGPGWDLASGFGSLDIAIVNKGIK